MTMLRRFYLSLPAWLLAGFLATSTAATVSDEAWLGRVAYSATPEALQEVKKIGREAYLEKQLNPPESEDLPSEVEAYVEKLDRLKRPLEGTLVDARLRRDDIKKATPVQRSKLQTQNAQEVQQFRRQTGERAVLRATFSPWQLREQLAWFWLNHFNVFMPTAPYALADYEDTLRQNVLGNFRDLLETSLKHPAMLVYLDNARSTKNQPNENYARELLELHTLGVDGGYTQQDVQALARILTGVRVVSREETPKLPPRLAKLYVREGAFEFDPRLHDFSDKKFLGRTIKGTGWAEVEQVLDLLATHPATARHLARRLSTYLVADDPPQELVDGVADVFIETKGDLRATVKFIVESEQFAAYAGKQFKSPLQYAISAVQVANIKNPERVVRVVRQALSQSGQPLYGRLTPDGYPLEGKSWISTGQLANRIAIAENVAGLRTRAKPQRKADDMQASEGMSSGLSGKMATPSQPEVDVKPMQKELFLKLAGPGFMYR